MPKRNEKTQNAATHSEVLLPQGAARGSTEEQRLAVANQTGAQFGLVLAEAEIWALVAQREEALAASGRYEFGGGILPRLVYHFCDSPYIAPEAYAATLAELQEMFYHAKTSCLDALPDEELLLAMKLWFDGECGGSLHYLRDTKLETLCRSIRFGEPFTLPQYPQYAEWEETDAT